MVRCELVGKRLVRYWLAFVVAISLHGSALATTKGLSQIVTPELQPEGDLSISFQAQDRKIANPYELQAELGVTSWAEVALFKGFDPQEFIFNSPEHFFAEIGKNNAHKQWGKDLEPYVVSGSPRWEVFRVV